MSTAPANSWSSGRAERACESFVAKSNCFRRIPLASSRQAERCSFMPVALLPSSAWSSSRSERACEALSKVESSSSFSVLLSIQMEDTENRIVDANSTTPMHCWSDDSKLFLMEEGKLEDAGFGASPSGTPMVGVAHPAWTFQKKTSYEDYDENSKTPVSKGLVWPAGISKVQPLAPLDLGPGWCQLDKLIASESLVWPAVAEPLG